MWAKASISRLFELCSESGESAVGRHSRSSTYPQAFAKIGGSLGRRQAGWVFGRPRSGQLTRNRQADRIRGELAIAPRASAANLYSVISEDKP